MQKNNNTVIVGIGNTIKGDDGIGPYIAAKIKGSINTGTVPENYIQKIINQHPDKIIIIDAVDFGGKPGEVKRFKEIDSANISISTHNMPPELFLSLIRQQTGADITIIAIQPKQLKLGAPLSEEVKKSADKVIAMLY